jgi:hypothetical protein
MHPGGFGGRGARDVTLNITADDHTGPATRSAARHFSRLKRAVERVDGTTARVATNWERQMKGLERAQERMVNRFQLNLIRRARLFGALGTNFFAAFVLSIIAALPQIGALISGAVVLAFGSGLAAIGIIGAAQSKKIQKQFQQAFDHIGRATRRISRPFQSVLSTVARVMRRTFDFFVPALRRAFITMAPALRRFVRNFGLAFRELRPAIKPITDAFVAVLNELGPRLKSMFASIARTLIRISDWVQRNPDVFVNVVQSLFGIVEAIGHVIVWLSELARKQQTNAVDMAASFAQFGADMLGVVAQVLTGLGGMIRSLGEFLVGLGRVIDKMPGVSGAADAALEAKGKMDRLAGGMDNAAGAASAARSRVSDLAAAIRGLHSKTVRVTTIFTRIETLQRSFGVSSNPSGRFSTGSFAAGDSGSRSGGPAPVNNFEVNTRVVIDGREVRAVARTEVVKEASRQAWRARVGSRY